MLDSATDLRGYIDRFLQENDFRKMDRMDFLRARFRAGLAWIWYPRGRGGLDLPQNRQAEMNEILAAAGAPDNNPTANSIGLGMAAPTILAFGTEAQKQRYLEPLWTGEEVWCQLFSEPGAGSDLANVATRAVRDGDEWIVTGQKVWTSNAHRARFAILLARTNPDLSKHAGLSYFLCDMQAPGVDVRPLRQLTGEAEFNEVFLDGVRLGADSLLGEEGDGWKIANATLNNERMAIGGKFPGRESGMIGVVTRRWRERPDLRTNELHDRLMRLWVDAEVSRLMGMRLQQKLAVGQPGPEGSALKLNFAQLNQQLTGLELEMLRGEGLVYDDWTMTRPDKVVMTGRDAGYRYLRAKGNSIEGGTSEILRNVIAERVLGLPKAAHADKTLAWKDTKK
jgi:alkylation response protein AidB-like acyl-CoA dehydrogenase